MERIGLMVTSQENSVYTFGQLFKTNETTRTHTQELWSLDLGVIHNPGEHGHWQNLGNGGPPKMCGMAMVKLQTNLFAHGSDLRMTSD